MAVPTHAMRFAMFTVLAVLAGAAIASACGSSSARSTGSTSPASGDAAGAAADQLTARVQRDEMLNAVITISALPIHDLDTAAQNGKIDNKYVPSVRLIVRELALTDWTSDVQPLTTKFHDDAVKLLQALDAGKDVDTIKPLSQAMHQDYHTFQEPAWNTLAKDLPPDAGGPSAQPMQSSQGTQSPASQTPAASSTP